MDNNIQKMILKIAKEFDSLDDNQEEMNLWWKRATKGQRMIALTCVIDACLSCYGDMWDRDINWAWSLAKNDEYSSIRESLLRLVKQCLPQK